MALSLTAYSQSVEGVATVDKNMNTSSLSASPPTHLKNFLFAVIAVSVLFLWGQSGYQISNDAFMVAISAYPVEADNDYIIAFNAKALESCGGAFYCQDYHSLTIMASAYNYLLVDLLFPIFMTVENGEAFLPPFVHAFSLSKIFSFAFAAAIFVFVTGNFRVRERTNIYIWIACFFALLFKFLPQLSDGFESHTRVLMALGVMTVSAGWFGARLVPRYGESSSISTTVIVMGCAFLLTIVILRMSPETASFGYLLGCFAAGVLLKLCQGRELENYNTLAIFGLMFFLISAYASGVMPYSWHEGTPVALLLIAIAIILTVDPKSRLVWVLLATPLFHIGGAAITSMALAFSEGIVCLFRRKISHLLVVSVLTAVTSLSLSYLLFTGRVPREFSIEAYIKIIQTLGFAYAVIMFTLFCAAGIFLLRQKNRILEHAALASFLLGTMEFSNGMHRAVLQAGFSGFEGSLYGIAHAFDYLGLTTISMVFILLVVSLCKCLKNRTCENDEHKPASSHVSRYVLAITVFLLAAGGGENLRLHPDKLVDLSKVITGDISVDEEEQYAFVNMKYDDSYPILYNPEPPYAAFPVPLVVAGEPLKYFSMLKLSMRIREGLVDPEKFRVYHIQSYAGP